MQLTMPEISPKGESLQRRPTIMFDHGTNKKKKKKKTRENTLCCLSRTGTNARFMWGGGEWFKVECQKRIGRSLKLIRKYRRWKERLNQSVLSRGRGAYLGHEADLLGQIHQPDEISLGQLWSGDTSSIPYLPPPPPPQATGTCTVQVDLSPLWGWAPGVGRCSSRDFNPTGQLFQSAVAVSPYRKNFKQIQVLCFSAQGPHKSATWKKLWGRRKGSKERPTPWLSLILLGQGEPECEAAGRSAPCFTCTPRAERLLSLCRQSADWLTLGSKQVGWNRVLLLLTEPSLQQTWHLKMGKIMITIKIAGATNHDISLPTEATDNLSSFAPCSLQTSLKLTLRVRFKRIILPYCIAKLLNRKEPIHLLFELTFTRFLQKGRKDSTVITVKIFMTERHQPSFPILDLNLVEQNV